MEIVLDTNIRKYMTNKTWTPYKTSGVKKNLISFLRGNRNGQYNMELKTQDCTKKRRTLR